MSEKEQAEAVEEKIIEPLLREGNRMVKEVIQPFIDHSYTSLYCTDIVKSAIWYQDHFGCKLLSCNPHFATLQLSPGRIMFLDRNSKIKETKFIVTEIDALKEHLNGLGAGIEFMEDPESVWFMMKDLDGNDLEIWCGDRFGCNGITYQYDAWVDQFNNVIFEKKEAIIALAVQSDGKMDLTNMAEKLMAACAAMSVIPKNTQVFTLVNPKQPDHVYGCIELTSRPRTDVPAGFESIDIPAQLYSFHTFNVSESFRDTYASKYEILGHYTLHRPADSGCIIEYYYDNEIQSYLPVAYSHEQ
jgi:hypothetical protein